MPITPDRLAHLMREAATRARLNPDKSLKMIDDAVLNAIDQTQDPLLVAQIRLANRLNMDYWLNRAFQAPEKIPEPNLSPEILRSVHENARVGLGETALEAFRAGQNAAFMIWMEVVFELTDDPEELKAVLDHSLRSISSFVEETARAIRIENAKGLEDAAQGSPAQRRVLVERLLEGETFDAPLAARRLGYRLDQRHQAVILWIDRMEEDPDILADFATRLTTLTPGKSILRIEEDKSRLWLWFTDKIDSKMLASLRPETVYVAIGPVLSGVEGFRRSHLDARTAERLIAEGPGDQRIATYEDTRLAALMGTNSALRDQFLEEVLGPLSTAPPHFAQSLRAYFLHGENVSRTAEALAIHRNTLMRHLEGAEDLLPRPLSEARIEVAAALEALHWRRRDGSAAS